jgi:hypothetical protein
MNLEPIGELLDKLGDETAECIDFIAPWVILLFLVHIFIQLLGGLSCVKI